MNIQMSSQRQIRYSELIRSLISEFLIREDFYDPDFEISSVTISFVKMSKDLRFANVYLMPLGGKDKNIILESLNQKKYIFQKFLSKARLTISEISGDSLFRFFLIFVKYYLVDMKSLNSGNN